MCVYVYVVCVCACACVYVWMCVCVCVCVCLRQRTRGGAWLAVHTVDTHGHSQSLNHGNPVHDVGGAPGCVHAASVRPQTQHIYKHNKRDHETSQ